MSLTASELLNRWVETVETCQIDQVTSLYATDGVLIPTVSNQIRYNHSEISDYFDHFLGKKPVCVIDSFHDFVKADLMVISGIYTFTFEDGSVAKARYSFLFSAIDSLIYQHHSSLLPE